MSDKISEMAGVTLEELVKKVGVAPEALHERCSDDHLRSISLFLDWRSVAPHLGLSETEREEIESDGKKHSGKKLKTLEKWKSKFVFQATYRRLIEVLLTIGRADHAEEVCKLLPKGIKCLCMYTVDINLLHTCMSMFYRVFQNWSCCVHSTYVGLQGNFRN